MIKNEQGLCNNLKAGIYYKTHPHENHVVYVTIYKVGKCMMPTVLKSVQILSHLVSSSL